MDLSFTPDEEAFQAEVRSFLARELPQQRLIMIDHQLGDADHHLERYVAMGQAG